MFSVAYYLLRVKINNKYVSIEAYVLIFYITILNIILILLY